jgi:HSP20 family protein
MIMADITPRSPFTDLQRVLDEWRDADWHLERMFPAMTSLRATDELLPVDVVEADGKYVVKASVPGFKRDDIKVDVTDGILTVSATRADEKEEKTERYVRREWHSGSLMRRVALRGVTHDSAVDAVLKDGVIEVTVAVPANQQPKQIEIREG